jgi:hypothetical protein
VCSLERWCARRGVVRRVTGACATARVRVSRRVGLEAVSSMCVRACVYRARAFAGQGARVCLTSPTPPGTWRACGRVVLLHEENGREDGTPPKSAECFESVRGGGWEGGGACSGQSRTRYGLLPARRLLSGRRLRREAAACLLGLCCCAFGCRRVVGAQQTGARLSAGVARNTTAQSPLCGRASLALRGL